MYPKPWRVLAEACPASAHPVTDRETIRKRAEERGGKPSCVKGTGDKDDIGMIRIDFPGYSAAPAELPGAASAPAAEPA